jgi:hypothetical protein
VDHGVFLGSQKNRYFLIICLLRMMDNTPFDVHDEEHRRQAEAELGIEILPGTEVMTDIENVQFIKANVSGPVLVPQPSSDCHDPLNWSKRRKMLVMAIALFFVFGLASGPLSIATQFDALIEAFNSDLEGVVQIVRIKVFFCINLDWYHGSHRRILQLSVDPNINQFRTPCSSHMEHNSLPDFVHLARKSNHIQEFYVGFCISWRRNRTCRGDHGR